MKNKLIMFSLAALFVIACSIYLSTDVANIKIKLFWVLVASIILSLLYVIVKLASKIKKKSNGKEESIQNIEIKKFEERERNVLAKDIQVKIVEQNSNIALRPAMEIPLIKPESKNEIQKAIAEHAQPNRYPVVHFHELEKKSKAPKNIIHYSEKEDIEKKKLRKEIAQLRKEINNHGKEKKAEVKKKLNKKSNKNKKKKK
jgi:hypothetical protein